MHMIPTFTQLEKAIQYIYRLSKVNWDSMVNLCEMMLKSSLN